MTLRDRNLDRLDGGRFDVVIVGGGINGAVSAAALAARGASVALIERGDIAGVTSQESSNLVWGGFKYLENYELGLVAKLCRSRNRLMRAYPSSIAELRFVATLDATAPFPSWLARLGTLGYWGIGQFATKPPTYHKADSISEIEPIVKTDTADAAVAYGDAYLKDNDARFVWSFVRGALDRGAIAVNYVSVDAASRIDDVWELAATDQETGRELRCTATALVNAAGPYVDRMNDAFKVDTEHRIVYSKGIHLVVPQLTTNEHVLAFFDDTERLFYVIPMAHRSVIGTTDTRTTDPDEGVTADDRAFVLGQINARLDLDKPLTVDDIVSERCGVRPLVVLDDGNDRTDVDWTSLSRKHEVEVDDDRAVISIFGGKLTDCLNVGEEVADAAAELLGRHGTTELRRGKNDWYGEESSSERRAFLRAASSVGLDRPPEVEREPSLAAVLWRRHGTAARHAVGAIAEDPSLAAPILPETDVLWAELPLYAERELVVRLDDFLRRRTKLALLHRADELAAAPEMTEVRRQLGL